VGVTRTTKSQSKSNIHVQIDGRIKVVYAAAFTSFGQECILRLRKTMVRLAFADMLLMWLFQLKFELNVTPRYLLATKSLSKSNNHVHNS
jgi:hypothetical protein